MKALYILACVLLGLAILLRVFAISFASRSAHALARNTQRTAESGQASNDEARSKAKAAALTSDTLTGASCIPALLGVVLWLYAMVLGYRRMMSIPVVLLVIYVASLILQV